MSGSAGVSSTGSTMLAQIQQLNKVMEQAILTKTDQATKLAKLAATGQVEGTREAATTAALDIVV